MCYFGPWLVSAHIRVVIAIPDIVGPSAPATNRGSSLGRLQSCSRSCWDPTTELSIGAQVGTLQVTQVMCRGTEIPGYSELKELIAMHSSTGQHGGDLNTDTITIIGATLDLQEKVVRQVGTASVDSPHALHPLITFHQGHDADQRRLHALDRQQTGLRDPPKDLCDRPQQGARVRRSRDPYFWCY